MKIYNVKTSSGQDEWKANRDEAFAMANLSNGSVTEYDAINGVQIHPMEINYDFNWTPND
jgi:hypothetical protein